MIKVVLGFMIVFGAVGGIENSATDWELMLACLIAAFGFVLMHAGAAQVNQE